VNAVPGCFGKVLFNATSDKPEDVSQWFWDFGDSTTAAQNPTEHIYQGPGPYQVIFVATDKNQCDTTVTLEASPGNSPTIDKLVIPNILTTNGDGLNEKLIIDPAYSECGNYTIKIFNRWGNLVFDSLNNNPEFSGQSKLGTKLGPGTYFWILSGQGYENKGTLEIVH
jgi:gliding motility-associated-like protein